MEIDSEIVVVSGLPRSGTSLMMQMLAAGGISPMTDEAREADEDNPRGYLEYAPVMDLEKDASWVGEARGRAVKVVSELLRHLPAEHRYRVIFMVRRIEEVLASQRRMLERRGTLRDDEPDDGQMELTFLRHVDEVVRWLGSQPNMRVLFVSYNQLFTKAAEHVERIDGHLGGGLDRAAMAAVVDPDLYRQRG